VELLLDAVPLMISSVASVIVKVGVASTGMSTIDLDGEFVPLPAIVVECDSERSKELDLSSSISSPHGVKFMS
jgi:hypothetical protein